MTGGRSGLRAPEPDERAPEPDERAPELGAIAPDGSPVEVYRRLPPNGEPELISGVLAPASAVLEVGAGTGRVTRGLVALGHRVTAVDIEPAMLAELPPEAEAILADATTLDLGPVFDAVVLGSHLVHAPGDLGPAFLAAARRHVRPGGAVAIQVYPESLDWLGSIGREAPLGDVRISIVAARGTGRGIAATVRYRVDARTWDQSFVAERLRHAEVVTALEAAGLRFDRWLAEPLGWLLARPAGE